MKFNTINTLQERGNKVAVLDKYGWVNALRGYAIMLVILTHSTQPFTISGVANAIANTGDMGVQLFFIMSSFTLFNSYSKRKLEADGRFVKRSFFMRRFFRIAPYYYVAGIFYTLYALFFQHQDIKVLYLIANYTFTNGIYLPAINYIPPGGWSIGTEMLFYLTIPILFKYIKSLKTAVIYLLSSIIISNILNFIIYSIVSNQTDYKWIDLRGWELYFWLPNQFPVFMFGIVLFFVYKFVKINERAGILLLTFSICAFTALAFFNFSLEYPNYLFQREYLYGFIFMLFAIGIYSTKNRFLVNKTIQNIGIVSFSMYLNHFLMVNAFIFIIKGTDLMFYNFLNFPRHMLSDNSFIFVITYVVIAYLTYLSSRFTFKRIEAPGIDFGNRLVDKFQNRNSHNK